MPKSKQPEQVLNELKRCYQIAFGTKEGTIVLEDLKKKCGFYNSTFDKDPYITANLEGQRQVVLHIQNMTKTQPNLGEIQNG